MTEKSNARGIYESMYDQEMADEMAKGSSLGIADMIYNQMSKYMDTEIKDKVEAVEEVEVDHGSVDVKG